MEHKPFGLDAIVGKISEKKRDKIFDAKYKNFENGYVDYNIANGLIQFETKKNDEDLKNIKDANQKTSDYRKKYRPDTFDVPEKNIHIIDPEKIGREYLKRKGDLAFFSMSEQAVYVIRSKKEIKNFAIYTHEILHFKAHNKIKHEKSHLSFPFKIFSKNKESGYRGGISYLDSKTNKVKFNNLNEAITERIATKIAWDKTKTTFEQKEIDELDKIATKSGVWKESYYHIDIEKYHKGEFADCLGPIIYGDQVFLYHSLVQKMSMKLNKPQEEVESIFEEAYFTGKLHKLAHIINDCFGDGAFSTLASVDTEDADLKKLEETITSLNAGKNSSEKEMYEKINYEIKSIKINLENAFDNKETKLIPFIKELILTIENLEVNNLIIDKNQTIHNLKMSVSISNKKAFLSYILKIMEPIIMLKVTHPDVNKKN